MFLPVIELPERERAEALRELCLADDAMLQQVQSMIAAHSPADHLFGEFDATVTSTEHCDRHKLTNRERLDLLLQVCDGVQYAYHKAVIHRDLKPSNVLVAIRDSKSVPKIIDFGVAKATAHRLTEQTVHTQLGALIGTPAYMSPEQADMTGQDVDTRTDVYAPGVILYELLVGALPFDLKELQ